MHTQFADDTARVGTATDVCSLADKAAVWSDSLAAVLKPLGIAQHNKRLQILCQLLPDTTEMYLTMEHELTRVGLSRNAVTLAVHLGTA